MRRTKSITQPGRLIFGNTDPIWNMFMINRVWGVSNTPFVIVNGTPIGVDSTKPNNVASYPINEGDNIIISVSSTMSPAKAVSLTVSTENGSSTVIATAWEMDFTTFQYTSKPLVGADIINPETGELLGTTDAEGRITVPAVGIVVRRQLLMMAVRQPLPIRLLHQEKILHSGQPWRWFAALRTASVALVASEILGI